MNNQLRLAPFSYVCGTRTVREPLISYCTACMNRPSQLAQTLEKNLESMARFDGEVELCLVNFIKDDTGWRIDQWIRSLGSRPHFRYCASFELLFWHASIAKNTAHLAAAGQYVVNLDCDNWLGPRDIEQLITYNGGKLTNTLFSGFSGQLIERRKRFRLNPYKRRSFRTVAADPGRRDGTYGRIGMCKSDFLALGGYDESLPPMGGAGSGLIPSRRGKVSALCSNTFSRYHAVYPEYQERWVAQHRNPEC